MFAFLLCKQWLQSGTLRVLPNVYNGHSRKSDNEGPVPHWPVQSHI